MAERINGLIAESRSKLLLGLANSTSKGLWAAVKGTQNKGNGLNKCNDVLSSPDLVNQFFANVATAKDYSLAEIISMRPPMSFDSNKLDSDISFSEMDIEPLLRKMKNSAPGCDNIPCWIYNYCSYELAGIIAFMINYSLRTGTLPTTWLTAIVTPIPKVPNPKCLTDYRPISVTPLLSRLTEKLLVRHWLRSALTAVDLRDQFAFKPTGSTTCALINCFDYVTKMLESNHYVRCILIDFTKAFDMVDHAILIRKLNYLDVPACIKNWIISFLTGRSQVT